MLTQKPFGHGVRKQHVFCSPGRKLCSHDYVCQKCTNFNSTRSNFTQLTILRLVLVEIARFSRKICNLSTNFYSFTEKPQTESTHERKDRLREFDRLRRSRYFCQKYRSSRVCLPEVPEEKLYRSMRFLVTDIYVEEILVSLADEGFGSKYVVYRTFSNRIPKIFFKKL